MSKLLLVNFVNGRYKEYIPLFLYFANRSYPEYDNLVMVQGTLEKKTRDILWEVIKQSPTEQDKKFNKNVIEENCFGKFKEDPDTIMTLRWLEFNKLYYKYAYIFIGDIDILLMRENPTLMEKHLKTMEMHNLRHSNTAGIDKGERVTGLHFMSSAGLLNMKPYMDFNCDLFEKKIPEYFINPKRNELDNQFVLRQLLLKSNMGVPMHTRFFYHGLHLGHSRVPGRWQALVDSGSKEEADYSEFYKQFVDAQKDKIYQMIYENLSPTVKGEIDSMVEVLEAKYGLH